MFPRTVSTDFENIPILLAERGYTNREEYSRTAQISLNIPHTSRAVFRTVSTDSENIPILLAERGYTNREEYSRTAQISLNIPHTSRAVFRTVSTDSENIPILLCRTRLYEPRGIFADSANKPPYTAYFTRCPALVALADAKGDFAACERRPTYAAPSRSLFERKRGFLRKPSKTLFN